MFPPSALFLFGTTSNFDSTSSPLGSDSYWLYDDKFCFLQSAAEFIQSLVNICRVRFITNQHQIQTFLQVNQWRKLIIECLRLNDVIIQLVDAGDFLAALEKSFS